MSWLSQDAWTATGALELERIAAAMYEAAPARWAPRWRDALPVMREHYRLVAACRVANLIDTAATWFTVTGWT